LKNILNKGVTLGLGLAITRKEQAQKLVDEMVKKGELSRDESVEFVEKLFQKGIETQMQLDQLITKKAQELVAKLNVATKEDIRRLEQRIDQIDQKINPAE